MFRQYVNIGFSVKDDAILLLVCRCQFLFSMFLMLGRFSLNVVLNLMQLLSVLSFSASSSFLLTDVALISNFLYKTCIVFIEHVIKLHFY